MIYRESPAFLIWVMTVAVLGVKMHISSLVQAVVRFKYRRFVRPDDAAVFGRGTEVAKEEHPLSQRMAAVWRNDLENIPLFLIIALGFVLAGGPLPWLRIYCGIYILARVAHTLFYAMPRQPHRNIAYQTGTVVTAALLVHLLYLFSANF